MSNRSYLQGRVRDWHGLMGVQHPAKPTCDLSGDDRRIWARVFLEEAMELGIALVGQVAAEDIALERSGYVRAKRADGNPGDLVEIADACIDASFVAAGVLSSAGIADYPLIEAVCDSNDEKVGGVKDENGKWQKPPGWTPPDIHGELIKQGWKP